jgi:MFS family permease
MAEKEAATPRTNPIPESGGNPEKPPPGRVPAWASRLLGALVERQFRRYTSGTFVWSAAHYLITLAQGYTIFKLTGSTLYLAALGAAVGVMMVIMPAIGGFLNDRLPRKRLLLAGSLGMMAAMAVVTVVYVMDRLAPWHLLAAGSVQGAFLGLDWTTRQAMLPAIVSRPRLVSGVSLDLASFNLARIVAPLAGGAVLASWRGPAAYGVIACLFAVSALMVLTLRPASAVREAHSPLGKDLKEIVALLRADQVLAVNVMFTGVNALMLGAVIYLLPAFAEEVLKAGEQGLSSLFTTIGAGSFAASALLSLAGGVRKAGLGLIVSNLLFAAGAAAFAYSGSLALAVLCAVWLGFFNAVHIALGAAAIQIASPETMRGRVFGAYEVAWGMLPLGGLVYGAVANWTGLPAALVIAAGVTAAFTVGVWVRATKLRALVFAH